MFKLLLLLCIFLLFNAAWIVGRKIYKTQSYLSAQRAEKPEQIASISEHVMTTHEEQVHLVDAYELELFDDVAQLFFQRHVAIQDRAQAEQLQQEILQKMPMQRQYTNSSDGFRGVVDFLEFLPSVTGILCRPLWRVLYACRPFWPRASSGNSYRSFTVRLCLILSAQEACK